MHLRDLFVELGEAAAEGQAAAIDAARRLIIARHFHDAATDGEPERLVANTVPVEIAPGREVQVPTFVLSTSERIRLTKIEVELESDIALDEEERSVSVGLKRGLCRRQSHAKIRATLELTGPTEAASLLEDALNAKMRSDLSRVIVDVGSDDEPLT